MEYNEKWRNIRKIMHQLLTTKQCETYRPFQDTESRQLLWDYLHEPHNFYRHNGRYANSVIMSVVFGKRTLATDPNIIQLFATIDDFLGNTTPGKWLVDSFPQLAKLPKWMQWWRPAALKYQHHQSDPPLETQYNIESWFMGLIVARVWMKYWNKLQDQIRDGTAPECFVKQLAESNYQEKGISEIQAAYLSGCTSSLLHSLLPFSFFHPLPLPRIPPG